MTHQPSQGFWACDESAYAVHYPHALTPDEAAEAYVADGDWRASNETAFHAISTWRTEADADGEFSIRSHKRTTNVLRHPVEPPCVRSCLRHAWAEDYVGSNRGGGVIIVDVCRQCGLRRVVDTWASSPINGEQGLRTIAYHEPSEED